MKIRTGFVSNSSSSSFVVIGTGSLTPTQPNDGGAYVVSPEYGESEFGWETTNYSYIGDRMNFAYLQTTYVDPLLGFIWKGMMQKVIAEHTGATEVRFEFVDNQYGLKGGYIDHQSAASEGCNIEIFENEDTLKRFLFAEDSYIQGGNDNG